MLRRLFAIAVIYILASISWFFLGGSMSLRSNDKHDALGADVAEMWGGPQEQLAPSLKLVWEEAKTETETFKDEATGKLTSHSKSVTRNFQKPLTLNQSRIATVLDLEHRQRGLLWYTTYGVEFGGDYEYVHEDDQAGELVIEHRFPSARASYDNFRFTAPGVDTPTLESDGNCRVARHRMAVKRGDRIKFNIGYKTRGLSTWTYSFGEGADRVRDFDLTLDTNFTAIDFPRSSLSPTTRDRTAAGWRVRWRFENLISGFPVGVKLPDKLNPGPLAGQISFFAPVCLGFFFVWMFVITLIRKIELHPMNYLFLAAAFFAFHLLFAYTVGHIAILPAFVISSIVSICLVISYLRLVVGLGFAVLEAGLSQLVYLVLFSYAHFYEGFTGLIVTIGSILTLFCLMQLTGRLKWSEVFVPREKRGSAGTGEAPLAPLRS